MREWATLPYPRAGVAVPLQGIRENAASWGAVGRGAAEAVRGTAALVQARQARPQQQEQADALQRVVGAGALAAFHERLNKALGETEESLRESDDAVRDWDYAWQQRSHPAVAEALETLPPELRRAGAAWAAERSAAACERARQARQVGEIQQARSQWQAQVDAAVQAGDESAACRWLAEGRGVFVPPAELEGRQRAARSRCGLRRWQQWLERAPEESLPALAEEGAALPEAAEDRRELEKSRAAAVAALQRRRGQELAAEVLAGQEPAEETVRQLRRAKLLPPPPPPGENAARSLCDWRRRIDEHGEPEADALRLQLAAAPLPLPERRLLLQRLTAMQAVPRSERLGVSQALNNLYRAGRFGCTEDAETLQYLARLQDEGAERLQRRRPAETEAWARALSRNTEDRWICFAE